MSVRTSHKDKLRLENAVSEKIPCCGIWLLCP